MSKEIAKILIDIKSVNFSFKNHFTLTSGLKSPVYVDCRKIISFTKERDFIIDKSFYYSNPFLGDLNQLKNLIERYLDMLDKLESSYNYLKIYSEEELNK